MLTAAANIGNKSETIRSLFHTDVSTKAIIAAAEALLAAQAMQTFMIDPSTWHEAMRLCYKTQWGAVRTLRSGCPDWLLIVRAPFFGYVSFDFAGRPVIVES
jgi:hypothetical protein